MSDNQQKPKTDWAKLNCGALWADQKVPGRYKGNIKVDGKVINVIVFPRRDTDSPTAPDLNLYISSAPTNASQSASKTQTAPTAAPKTQPQRQNPPQTQNKQSSNTPPPDLL